MNDPELAETAARQRKSISVTLHDFVAPEDGQDRCAFVYTATPNHVQCNVHADGHKPSTAVAIEGTAVRRVYASPLTVGQLRAALDGVSDEVPVCVPGGEYDLTDAESCGVETVEWIDDPDDEDPENAKYDRQCFVLHSSYG